MTAWGVSGQCSLWLCCNKTCFFTQCHSQLSVSHRQKLPIACIYQTGWILYLFAQGWSLRPSIHNVNCCTYNISPLDYLLQCHESTLCLLCYIELISLSLIVSSYHFMLFSPSCIVPKQLYMLNRMHLPTIYKIWASWSIWSQLKLAEPWLIHSLAFPSGVSYLISCSFSA